eukprot:scaffold2840_cov379-Prasinococcus_capsulatus_cf.AAC.6
MTLWTCCGAGTITMCSCKFSIAATLDRWESALTALPVDGRSSRPGHCWAHLPARCGRAFAPVRRGAPSHARAWAVPSHSSEGAAGDRSMLQSCSRRRPPPRCRRTARIGDPPTRTKASPRRAQPRPGCLWMRQCRGWLAQEHAYPFPGVAEELRVKYEGHDVGMPVALMQPRPDSRISHLCDGHFTPLLGLHVRPVVQTDTRLGPHLLLEPLRPPLEQASNESTGARSAP